MPTPQSRPEHLVSLAGLVGNLGKMARQKGEGLDCPISHRLTVANETPNCSAGRDILQEFGRAASRVSLTVNDVGIGWQFGWPENMSVGLGLA